MNKIKLYYIEYKTAIVFYGEYTEEDYLLVDKNKVEEWYFKQEILDNKKFELIEIM